MKKEFQGVILFLLMSFFTVFMYMDSCYNRLLTTNDIFINQIEKDRQIYEETYDYLNTEIKSLKAENLDLKNKLNQSVENTWQEPDFTDGEIYLLAQIVQLEAGFPRDDEINQSQRYVTQVILNRVGSDKFPNSIEEVIYSNKGTVQFNSAYSEDIDILVPDSQTFMNVYNVLFNGTDLPQYVTYFYSSKVTNNWLNTLNTYITVGGTVFAYN